MVATSLLTLPDVARREGVALDSLRALVRRTPDLKALGSRVGPTRCYSSEEAERIVQAFFARRAKAATST
jgi:hypothetical protein